MKKIATFLLIFLLPFSLITAQSQFENAGFEDWEPEPASPFFEPVNWSSIKTSDHTAAAASQIVIFRSDTAHSGEYSVHLVNKWQAIISKVATGTMTNGRLHVDPGFDLKKSTSYTDTARVEWNTPLTKRPDSLVGWYMANAVPGDFPTAKVILHADSNSIPGDSAKWIARAYWQGESGAQVNQWTRFSAPFDYYLEDTPEYILATITSGNGLYALDKSEAWYDDLELIYNGTGITEKTLRDLKAYYANGEVVVRIDDPQLRHAKVNIVDITGRIVYSDMVEQMLENRFRLNLENGIYIVNLSTAQDQLSKKIVVQ